MLNKVMIIGRLGRDPEVRYAQSGMPIANLNVATDEYFMDKDGNRQERTEWHRIVVFQRQAENCAKFLTKGSLVYVEGSLQTRKWQDQEGKERSTTEIKAQQVRFLDRSREREGETGEMRQGAYSGSRQAYQRGGNNGEPGSQNPASSFGQRRQTQPDDDLGPAFPSEGSQMDEVPF